MMRYSSGQLFALRRRSSALSKSIPPSVVNCIHSLNLQRCRGCRGRVRKHRSIGVVARTHLPNRTPVMDGDRRCRCLVYPPRIRLGDPDASADGVSAPPNLYILNANSIAKPHALDQLSVELDNYNVDVSIITETHLKKHHQSSMIKIDGYNIFRRDRLARCRGGVAIFVRSEYDAIEVPMDGDTRTLLWVRVMMPREPVLIGALYHPPKPIYQTDILIEQLERRNVQLLA